MTIQKEAIAKAPAGRKRRSPLDRKQILAVVGKDPNYVYRIVNDTEDRVALMQERGYEHVEKDEVKVGDKRIDNASAPGSVTQISVGKGQKAFLMRIRKEWYDEDQQAKQDEIMATERETKRKSNDPRQQALDGTYGKLDITRS